MKFTKFFCVASLVLVTGGGGIAIAAPKDVSTPRDTIPPNIVTNSNRPMMMLATSKDHTLFGPIYTDFEDIDDDGVIDTTFKPTFKYYGYFDASKCYSYTSSIFEPEAAAVITGGRYTCSAAQSLWSGNFLNWATMTRLDVIRKMLYGGKRKIDTPSKTSTASSTVLERANLSLDSHSFVKYYRGTDIRDYTPFSQSDLTKATGDNSGNYAGLSICNQSDTDGEGGNPIIKLAKGNYRLWSTVEGRVCGWSSGQLGPKLSRYFNDADKGAGGIAHEQNPPNNATDGARYGSTGPELTVRVRVCKASLLGDEKCQPFPADSTTNFKPYGIFQEFGLASTTSAAARSEFGVITGSYDNNLTAGALRKNMGDFADEINLTSGAFCHNNGSDTQCAATLADGRSTGLGAIKSLDSLVLFGRNGSNYDGSGAQLPVEMTDGTLSAWGNPVGEMVVQALQYYSGVASTNPSSSSKDTSRGLASKSWADPLSNANATRKSLYGNAICRPLYTLALSSSALSFDGQASGPFATLPNRSQGALSSYTNAIGANEGLNGTLRSVGSVTGGFGETCSGKTLSTLSNVSGICPEAPAIGGTYEVAGAALYANTSDIRTVSSPPSDLKYVQNALRVKTLTASLSGGAARVDIPIPGSNPKKFVYITPESLWNANGKRMPGAMLTFASIASGPRFGTFVVTWNDSLFGGDYDMDIAGFLRYDVIDDALSPSGYSIRITTDILNVGAGYTGTHGFSVLGTNADRRYLTHRHNADDGPMVGAEGHLCQGVGNPAGTGNACNVSSAWNQIRNADFPVITTLQMIGVNNVIIEEPLWYAAKYGSFNSSSRNPDGTFSTVTLPPNQASWDNVKADGSLGSDGIPDGYFLARRPDILEAQLRKALDALAKDSNAAPATSSANLLVGGYKYTVNFDSTTVAGSLESYKINADGDFESAYSWEAGSLLRTNSSSNGGSTRKIITNSGNTGVPFRWTSLPAAYKSQMTTDSTNVLTTTNAEKAVAYIRGDQSLEGLNGFRQRGTTLLGPIVNSTPWLQTKPNAKFFGGAFADYGAFLKANANRKKLLWVGANDGMLHAFNADTGVEEFAYVPGALANRLAEIPLQRGTTARTKLEGINYTSNASELQPSGTVWPYVDGSPYTADVKVGTDWKTYVFGSLGRGGKAVFALDVTDTAAMTEGNASNVFKWQFTSDDDADLGYITSSVARHAATTQPLTIAKMNNGKFAMLLANGYKSSTGKSVLFILYMDGPSAGSWTGRYKKIVADAGTDNGLSVPRWDDIDGNGTADVAYAGDLKGNLWKFNLASTDDADWDVAYKAGGVNKPLYVADITKLVAGVSTTFRLPITSTPETLYMGRGGLLVTFGTGNAFEVGDFPRTDRGNRVYGIWDRPGMGTGTGVGKALPSGISTLAVRTFTRDANGVVTLNASLTTPLDWSTHNGWYFDLPDSAEAVLSDPQLKAGVLFFTSVRPNTAAEQCSNKPYASLFTIDPISGKAERAAQGTVTVGGAKIIVVANKYDDQKPAPVSSILTPKPFKKPACVAGDPGCTCVGSKCTKESICGKDQRAYGVIGRTSDVTVCVDRAPRLQWREIPGLRTDK